MGGRKGRYSSVASIPVFIVILVRPGAWVRKQNWSGLFFSLLCKQILHSVYQEFSNSHSLCLNFLLS